MLKAVIFDLDNTLIDFWKMKTQAVEAALHAMLSSGLNINKPKAKAELFKLYDKHGIEYRNIFQKFLLHVHGKVDYKILGKAIVAYRRERPNFMQPYPGTINVLKKLRKKYKLAIISDAPRMKAWIRLVSIGLEDFFDAVVTFDDTKKKKPHKLPFRRALNQLKIKPNEALMVGDYISRDILGAKIIGMKTAFAKYGSLRKLNKNMKSNADFELSNIQDLLEVVRKIK